MPRDNKRLIIIYKFKSNCLQNIRIYSIRYYTQTIVGRRLKYKYLYRMLAKCVTIQAPCLARPSRSLYIDQSWWRRSRDCSPLDGCGRASSILDARYRRATSERWYLYRRRPPRTSVAWRIFTLLSAIR